MSCPRCDSKRTKWRSGVGFDNEIICFDCWATWEPGSIDESRLRDEGAEIRVKEKAAAGKRKAAEQAVADLEYAKMMGMGMDAPLC